MSILILALALQAPVESSLSFSNGGITLEGTLTLPVGNGPWPGVLIIAGSGPTDRNGNSAAGLATNNFQQLAHGLAELGIASLRYDKRGLPSSTGTFDMASTTLEHFAADAIAGIRALDARADIGKVYLLGHSEGGTLALLAARDGAPHAGVILVATMGRRFSTVLREQVARTAPPAMMVQFDSAWAAYMRGETVTGLHPGLMPLFSPATRLFLQSWENVNAPGLIAGLEAPVLVIQGDTDVQITVADARELASTKPDVTLEIVPGMNHVLKEASGSTALEQMASYTNPAIPLMPGLVSVVVGWIGAH
ncbi:MAG: alpha/beta fold hydrolase [Gemmatimonadales bacterium]